MADERREDEEFVDDAAAALDEPRRRAGEEGRTLEEQADPLAVDDEDEVRAY